MGGKKEMSVPPKQAGQYDAPPPPYSPEYQYNGPPPQVQQGYQYQYQGQQQAPYPAPGWAPPPAPAQAQMPATQVVVQPITTQPTTRIVVVGGCPTCRAGVLEDSYGCCAIFMGIFFFPIGILCCLAMRERRCSNCGAHFG